MSDYRVQTGEGARIIVVCRDSANAGVSGATVDLAIRRDSDGYWWNGTAWQSTYVANTMTETDSTNLAGCYHYDFRPASGDFYAIMQASTTDVSVVNSPMFGTIAVGSWVDNIDSAVSEVEQQAEFQRIAARLGNVFLDTEFQKLRGLISGLDSRLGRLEQKRV